MVVLSSYIEAAKTLQSNVYEQFTRTKTVIVTVCSLAGPDRPDPSSGPLLTRDQGSRNTITAVLSGSEGMDRVVFTGAKMSRERMREVAPGK